MTRAVVNRNDKRSSVKTVILYSTNSAVHYTRTRLFKHLKA